MTTGLLFECDEQVAAWLFTQMGWPAYKFDKAVGLVSAKGELIGAVLYQHYNGCNVECSYYGRKTMTAGIIRCLARFTLLTFNPSRMTVNTSKRNKRFIRSLTRFGFKLEGTSRCYYGLEDNNRNTAVRFVAFREDIERVARFKEYEPDVDDPTAPVDSNAE
jgi:RimJ/RimL family protein N-acetyltransferase